MYFSRSCPRANKSPSLLSGTETLDSCIHTCLLSDDRLAIFFYTILSPFLLCIVFQHLPNLCYALTTACVCVYERERECVSVCLSVCFSIGFLSSLWGWGLDYFFSLLDWALPQNNPERGENECSSRPASSLFLVRLSSITTLCPELGCCRLKLFSLCSDSVQITNIELA